jgi:hypothetical protein
MVEYDEEICRNMYTFQHDTDRPVMSGVLVTYRLGLDLVTGFIAPYTFITRDYR